MPGHIYATALRPRFSLVVNGNGRSLVMRLGRDTADLLEGSLLLGVQMRGKMLETGLLTELPVTKSGSLLSLIK